MSKIVKQTRLLTGWSNVDHIVVQHPDGTTWERTLEDHGNSAAVLPYDPKRRICLLVSQPRPAVMLSGAPDDLLEAPAGMLDEGETYNLAARRETMEEAGLLLDTLELVVTLWTMPGLSTERTGIFLATYSSHQRIAAGGGIAADNERISLNEISLEALGALVMSGRLEDGKTLVAAQALMLRRPDLF